MQQRNSFPVHYLIAASMAAGVAAWPLLASAGVTAEEAQQLKTTLTPLGGERAANKDGSIPAWTGGESKPPAGYKSTDRRTDPFAGDKVLYAITAKNMDQYADKLSDGQKALLKKYPTYRIDVYPTRRTAAAPQWVYDNTFKNATRASLKDGPNYQLPSGAYGGPPFPIPKSGIEVVWNHLLRFQGSSTKVTGGSSWMVTADGKKVMTVQGEQDIKMPYYDPQGSAEKFDGPFWLTRVGNWGPPIRAGEAIVGRVNMDDTKSLAWVYLTGQRRVRKLPNPSGDTPTPTSAGVMTFDEINVYAQQPGLFNWKLAGKKEMLVPYNANKTFAAPNPEATMTGQHMNPDYVRWELHRVWVVDAELAPGKRHAAPKARYYFDEDSWLAVLGDRWDAKGQLWKTLFGLTVVYPEIPLTDHALYGFYDLVSGSWFSGPHVTLPNSVSLQQVPPLKDEVFTPDAMVGDQLR
jgi:hypothetical protein